MATAPASVQFTVARQIAQCRCKGFTLIELLIVIALLATLAALAAPSFTRLTAGQRIKTASADLYSTLVRARSEALKRNASVTITQKTAGSWQSGWQIVDPSNAALILYEQAAMQGLIITGPTDLRYQSSGRLLSAVAPQFDITNTGTDKHAYICINLSGRPFQAATPC